MRHAVRLLHIFAPRLVCRPANKWVFAQQPTACRFYAMPQQTSFRKAQQGRVPSFPRRACLCSSASVHPCLLNGCANG